MICQSYSQASIYYYALKLLKNNLNLPIAHLRYLLGGDHPSQTTNYTMFLLISNKKILRVVFQQHLNSLLAQRFKTISTYSKHNNFFITIYNYSKGA